MSGELERPKRKILVHLEDVCWHLNNATMTDEAKEKFLDLVAQAIKVMMGFDLKVIK